MTTFLPELPSAATVRQSNYLSIPLPSPYAELLGKLPRQVQFSMMIYGEPGSGKSSLSLKIANVLAKATNKYVLYNANEEPLESGSINLRLNMLNINDTRIKILDARDFDILQMHLRTGKYKFCVIDSLNNFEGVSDMDVLNLMQEFPNVSFIFLSMVDKQNKAKATKTFEHLVFAVYFTENSKTGEAIVRLKKSRYGATLREMNIFEA